MSLLRCLAVTYGKKTSCAVVLVVLAVHINAPAQSVTTQAKFERASPLFIPHSDDEFWDDRFTVGGPNSSVIDMVIDDAGDLIVAGFFSTAGREITRKVARWDGSMWHPVGDGLTSQASINSLLKDGNGTLFMGGWDLTDLSRGDDLLAALEGDTWVSKGTSEWYGIVQAMAVDDVGNFYAGGDIISATNNRVRHIVKFDGVSWSVLGGNVEGTTRAMAVGNNGNLYIGGVFDAIDGVAINKIAMWNGGAWTPIGEGLIPEAVYTMATDADGNLYVGGSFEIPGVTTSTNLVMWDGVSWSPMDTGFDGVVQALIFDNQGQLLAGGGHYDANRNFSGGVAKWEGNAWSSFGGTLHHPVRALAVDEAGNVYAGGTHLIADEVASNVILWDGQAWSPVTEETGLGLNANTTAVVADASCDIYVAGNFILAGSTHVDRVARWDNQSWVPVGGGIEGNVEDLAISDDGKLYAGGYFGMVRGSPVNSVAMWNGLHWVPLGDGLKNQEYPGRVNVLAIDQNGALYAGGEFDTAGGQPVNNIAKWDGTSWQPLGDGVKGGVYSTSIDAMAIDGNGNLYVGGEFEIASIVSAKNVAMWDGTVWSRLGSGLDDRDTGGSVRTLAVDKNGRLFAGGSFSKAGNTTAYNLARWDGARWSKLGIGFNTVVLSLVADDEGDLYVGGQFDALGPGGSIPVNYIARWDNASLSSLGSGVNGYVRDMALDGRGNLYLAGNISAAGNNVSNGIAKWEIRPNNDDGCAERPINAPQAVTAATSYYPNPFADYATIEVSVNEPQQLSVRVYDASGRFVTQLFEGETQALQFQRFRLDGAGLSSGTYFVRI